MLFFVLLCCCSHRVFVCVLQTAQAGPDEQEEQYDSLFSSDFDDSPQQPQQSAQQVCICLPVSILFLVLIACSLLCVSWRSSAKRFTLAPRRRPDLI